MLLVFIVGILLVGLVFGSSSASSQEPSSEELDSLFAFRGIAYQQDDPQGDAGNPYIKEEATIYEGVFLFRKKIGEKNAIEANITGDVVTAASYDDAKDKAETVSGATGYNPGRWNVSVGWKRKPDADTTWRVQAGYGQEFAYRTAGVGLGFGQSFAEGATQISINLQYFDDTVRVIRYDGELEKDASRRTSTVNIGLTQSLTPKSVLNLGLSYTDQSGFLATSFNAVKVGDEFDIEIVPDERRRESYSARYKYALGRDSVQLGYSYYVDNWDIDASVSEFKYFFNLYGEKWTIEPSYRFYTQTQASFFAIDFPVRQEYQTSDSDLGEFTGNAVGLLNSWRLGDHTYDIGFNYYRRSDDLDFYWLTIGWSVR